MILGMNLAKNRPPTSPGEMLVEEFLKPMGITQAELAEKTGLGARCVNEICRDKRAITARSAILLSDFFNVSVDFWLNMQRATDVWNELKKMGRLSEIKSPSLVKKATVKVAKSKVTKANVTKQLSRKPKKRSSKRSVTAKSA
jgi:antitoxin HigA-1